MARILVIDDSSVQRILAKSALEADGHEVVAANGGDEGLSLARQETFDCVLLDWFMPETSGSDVIRALHAENAREHRIIVVTSDPDDATRDECLQFGVAAVIDKPRDAAELREVVKSVIDGQI